MSGSAKSRNVFSDPTAEELAWLIPSGARLPDGRAADGLLLAGMIAEWRRILGGAVYVSRHQRAWAEIADDPTNPGSQRLEGEANDITAVLNHSLGRAITAGLKGPYDGGNVPGNSYLVAVAPLEDTAAVLLAVLDRHLTCGGELAAWYLASPCDIQNCLYHGDGRGPERRGSGVASLDYATLPRLYWHPGLGTVETPPADWDRIASLPVEERRPIRLPMSATVPPGVFQPKPRSR